MSEQEIIFMFLKIGIVLVGLLSVTPIMLFVERRGSALLQNRLGPNRIGPLGLFQSVLDVLKFIFKEDRAPGHVNKFYFSLAPIVTVIPALMTFAVIPFAGNDFIIANLDVGILYCFSIASLGVYGIIMAGWASNNKYSLLGSLRSSAQMISYELTLGLSIVGMIMVFQSLKLTDIVAGQGETLFSIGGYNVPKYGIFIQPVGFILFLVSSFAETNRLPFDLPEGESELIVASALLSTLFFGGWHYLPGFEWLAAQFSDGSPDKAYMVSSLFHGLSFVIKIASFMWFFVWVRWTLPRFRFDQLMNFGWRVLFPIALLNVFVTGLLIYFGVL
jgi:NADH-quinone oxidoreductase subunit H